jgi:diadenosine tetraphosphate (Ap4A) HIT family hydrolase
MRDWDRWKNTEEGKVRCIEKTDNDDFVAVLENSPRIDGEILIISKRCDDNPYDDVSDILRLSGEERTSLCKILGETIELMKRNFKAQKVYLYSFCEHWERDEILYPDKKTTEHLHFHLMPRYNILRIRELAAERIFDIPTRDLSFSELGTLKGKLVCER